MDFVGVPCAFSLWLFFNTGLIFYLLVCFLKRVKETMELDREGVRGDEEGQMMISIYRMKNIHFQSKNNAIKERKGERERKKVCMGGGCVRKYTGPSRWLNQKRHLYTKPKDLRRVLGPTWKREAIPSCPLTSIYVL